jgi:protocatechuate 3,4-dioxygenase beta subunit
LEGVQAPYSGRVVDAATGKPLKGALVMVVWQAEDTEIDR